MKCDINSIIDASSKSKIMYLVTKWKLKKLVAKGKTIKQSLRLRFVASFLS